MSRSGLPTPFWQGRGVVLYHGRAEDIVPRLKEPGHVLLDPPYSRHVHSKSRAGERAVPLLDGAGKMSKSAISRAKGFGFEYLKPKLRRCLAAHAARLGARWTMVFCDVESSWLWRMSLICAGLDYRRAMIWDKLGCAPQFTGDQPAVAAECIVLAHPKPGRGAERRRWNAGGKRGIYRVPIELDRGGTGRITRINETQKPEDLILQLIIDFTDRDELIHDWTAGGCTTGVCAMRLARRAILVEKRIEQCEKAAIRLEAEAAYVPTATLLGRQRPLFPLEAANA